MDNLINKFINEHIRLYSLFKVRGLETNDNYLKEPLLFTKQQPQCRTSYSTQI